MLKELHIRNLVLVEKASIFFEKGLNIITGETGAGKSVIIGSLNLLLGERASQSSIRLGEKKCTVQGVFDVSQNRLALEVLDEMGIPVDDTLIIVRRELMTSGSNRQFINDLPVSLTALKQLGNVLIDMHGQHDHQSLFSTTMHRTYLDWFARLDDELSEYQKLYDEYIAKMGKLEQLKSSKSNSNRERQFWEYELDELTKAQLTEDEEERLTEEHTLLSNAQNIKDKCYSLYTALYESDRSIHDAVSEVHKHLLDLARIDSFFESRCELTTQLSALIEELSMDLQARGESFDCDQGRLEEVEKRIDLIERLKRKFHKTVPEMLEYQEWLHAQLQESEENNIEIEKLEAECENLLKILNTHADSLSKKRKSAGEELSSKIAIEFNKIGMKDAQIKVAVTVYDKLTEFGRDTIEFMFAPNRGESWAPLKDSASGGEISRVMLALKSLFADADNISAMVFDEIDVNIGGSTARDVGKRMFDLSQKHQVICITHLPQIAGFANIHFKVEKNVSDERTITVITRLSQDERIAEVSRMLGGESMTSVTRKHAQELIENSI